MERSTRKDQLARTTISLPESLLSALDEMIAKRGAASRSEAITKMISAQLIEHKQELGKQIMAGTITLIYDHARQGLATKLLKIQHKWLKEVISSQRVHLENHHTLEVLLVQGPGAKLKQIATELIGCKGVTHGYLTVTSTILPPLH